MRGKADFFESVIARSTQHKSKSEDGSECYVDTVVIKIRLKNQHVYMMYYDLVKDQEYHSLTCSSNIDRASITAYTAALELSWIAPRR